MASWFVDLTPLRITIYYIRTPPFCLYALSDPHCNATIGSIFIVATLITKLDFLENIAAIFRGAAREVINARTHPQTEKQKPEKVEEEILEESNLSVSDYEKRITKAMLRTDSSKVIEYLAVEKATLKYLSEIFGPIERNPVVTVKNRIFRFDGRKKLSDHLEYIFEVKYSSNLHFIKHEALPRLRLLALDYRQATKRIVVMHLVVVSDELRKEKAKIMQELGAVSRGFHIRYIILDKREIDLA